MHGQSQFFSDVIRYRRKKNSNRQQQNQRRASKFRRQLESNKLIRLVDGQGDDILVEGGRQFANNYHQSVVDAIHLGSQQIVYWRQRRVAPGYGEAGMWDGIRGRQGRQS